MKNKEYLRTDNEGTKVKTTAVETEVKLKNPKKNELPDIEPENKQTGLHHISSDRSSAERFNLHEDESARDNSQVTVANEQEFEGEEEGANKDGIVIREQAPGIEDITQPRNVDKTTEARRTSTRNKKAPSIRGNYFLW